MNQPKGLNKYVQISLTTVKVFTTKGDIFYISPESVEVIKSRTWWIHDGRYVVTKIKNKRVFLHNFLMSPPDGYIVDHKDGDGLNNRLDNYRVVTQSENYLNKKQYSNSKYFRGVTFDENRNNFISRIQVNKRAIFLGRFDDLEQAIKARVSAEIKYFGENRRYK